MAKLTPSQRWKRHILERFAALEMSGELKPLCAEGLTVLGRKTLFTPEEWWQRDIRKLISLPEYQKWQGKCGEVADRFGLADWTVQMACLLKGFSPKNEGNSGIVLESIWAQIRVVTENTGVTYLKWLCYEAQQLGLYVIQRFGSLDFPRVYLDPGSPPDPLTTLLRPARHNAFYFRVEIPPGYPPEASRQLQKKASDLERELLRRLGYSVPKRLRSSPLVTMAKDLKADKKRLTGEESLQIVDKIFPGHDEYQDRKFLQRSHSRKHKVRRRIIEPYEQKP